MLPSQNSTVVPPKIVAVGTPSTVVRPGDAGSVFPRVRLLRTPKGGHGGRSASAVRAETTSVPDRPCYSRCRIRYGLNHVAF